MLKPRSIFGGWPKNIVVLNVVSSRFRKLICCCSNVDGGSVDGGNGTDDDDRISFTFTELYDVDIDCQSNVFDDVNVPVLLAG